MPIDRALWPSHLGSGRARHEALSAAFPGKIMHATLGRLLDGDTDIIRYSVIAKRKWEEFFATHRNQPVSEWAGWLSDQQVSFFEQQCGGRSLGQDIMEWSGFATLYDVQVGFEGNLEAAKKLAEAFERSSCSIEVKHGAARAAENYYLDEK